MAKTEIDEVSLPKRPAKLGPGFNVRSEKLGKTDFRSAVDLSVDGFMLTKDELDQFMGKGYWNSVYETRSGGRPPTPAWRKVKTVKIGDKYGAEASISFGAASIKAVEISEGTVKSIALTFEEGGLTRMSFTLQAHDEGIEDAFAKFARKMRSEIDIDLVLGEPEEEVDESQQQLGLEENEGGVSNKPAGSGDGEISRTGAAINASAAKAGKKAAKKAAAKRSRAH